MTPAQIQGHAGKTRRLGWLFLLATTATACGGSETEPNDLVEQPPPYAFDLFLRGNFNDWGSAGKEIRFAYNGDGRYRAYVRLNPGRYMFKIADAQWTESSTFSLDIDQAKTLTLGTNLALMPAPGSGNHTNFVAPVSGVYAFELSVERSDLTRPTLRVADERPPLDEGMALRGTFNDFGAKTLEMLTWVYYGDGVYRVSTRIDAGEHRFEVDGTRTTFSVAANGTGRIALDREASLVEAFEGTTTFLTIPVDGDYTFVLTVATDPVRARLRVRPARAGEPVTVNPHRGAAAVEFLEDATTGARAAVSQTTLNDRRRYALSTTLPLLSASAESVRFVDETAGAMAVRTGHLMFDALFALALEEARQNSVDTVSDGSFEDMPCACFQTGELWRFVWTRDVAYSVHLALAALDPARSRNTLLFKQSGKRQLPPSGLGESGPEIVQDTGSGGSWPISTDRVVWALGAWELLKYLDGEERTAFRDQVYEVLATTARTDRAAVYDDRDGLYRGEQSFLDWREQSYPSWTADDVVHLGMSKALSTNVGHYRLLEVAAALAAEKGVSPSPPFRAWADALATAIRTQFSLPDEGLYSSIKHTERDAVALRKFDLLGLSLAIAEGVIPVQDGAAILGRYPHTDVGAPVIWPQQPDVPVYHNRAIWPFVSAYALRAAKAANHDGVATAQVQSLMRGAALNVSNMENLEFMTGRPAFLDGDHPELFGPVLNSRRQLWSVAGYLSMVLDGVFGLEATQEGIRFAPYLPHTLRQELFAEATTLELQRFPYKGRTITVNVALPPNSNVRLGAYRVVSTTLNGQAWSTSAPITVNDLQVGADNLLVIQLAAPLDNTFRDVNRLTRLDPFDLGDMRVYAPREPKILLLQMTPDGALLQWSAEGETATTFDVFRNGERVASGLRTLEWTDTTALDATRNTYCYAVAQVSPKLHTAPLLRSGNVSHHSRPRCLAASAVTFAAGAGLVSPDASPVEVTGGRAYFRDWGAPDQRLVVDRFTPSESGEYRLSLGYANRLAHVSTGVTATTKWLQVLRAGTNEVVGEGMVVMPHRGVEGVTESSIMPVRLVANETYRIEVSDFFNMSYLDFFSRYRGRGGSEGPVNRCDVAELRVELASP